jgi:hypothetical protein
MTTKKVLAVVLILCALLGYCALPLTSVSAITITLENQGGEPIAGTARASFVDGEGGKIVDVALGELPSWQNNIHWWAHSSHATSLLRPEDARRAMSVLIEAEGCAPLTVPMELHGQYVPPSLMPHGGGRAYMLYEFAQTVRLECGNP